MSRKPSLKPGTLSREELMERRIADLERVVRRIPARAVSSGADQTATVVNQTTHALAVGNVIRHNGTIWTKSQADTVANAVVGGIVIAVLSPDVFVMATGGYVAGLSGLTAGSVHYLSATTAGALVTTAPPNVSVPILLADTTTSGVLVSMTKDAGITNGLSLPTLFLANITTPSTSSVSAPEKGVAYVWLTGGGGGGGRAGGAISSYVASSSGGSPTTAQYAAIAGGGGGAGGRIFAAFAVNAGDVISYTCGSKGARGSAAGDAGSNGTNSSASVGFNSVTASYGYGGAGTALRGLGGRGGNGSGGPVANAVLVIPGTGQPGQTGSSGTFPFGVTVRGGLGGAGASGENYVTGTGPDGNHVDGVDGSVLIGFTPS